MPIHIFHKLLPGSFTRPLLMVCVCLCLGLAPAPHANNTILLKADQPHGSAASDQNLFDSLMRSAAMVLYFSPDSARTIALEALEMLSPDELGPRIRLLNLVGTSHHLQANYGEALGYYHDALSHALQLNDSTRTANLFNNIGIAHLNTGNYKDAYDYFLRALDQYETMQQPRNISSTRNNIGLLFRELNNSDRALEHFTLALEGFTLAGDSVGIAAALNNIGSVYALDELPEEAGSYFEKALLMATVSNNSFGLSVAHQGMATVYQKQDSLSRAIFHFRETIAIADKMNQPFVKANAYLGLSKILMEDNDLPGALTYAEMALQIALQIQNRVLEYECYNILSQVHEQMGNFRQSLNYHKHFHQLKEELLNQTIVHQVHNLELSSLSEANKLQQLELERKELAISKKNNLLWFATLFFAVSIAGLYFFYLNRRNRQRVKLQQTIIELNEKKSLAAVEAEIQERKRIGQELHDGLGQLLSVAGLNISVLQKKSNISEKRKQELLDAVMQSVDEAFAEVRNISHNLAPSLLSERGLKGALKNLSDQVNQSNQLHMHFETFGLNGTLNSLVENTLFRAIQEILNNAIKHSNAQNLYVQIAQGNHEITLMGEDDGIGFAANELYANNGNGLTHMKTRIENLNGSMHIDSNPARGTIISIAIPLNPGQNVSTPYQSISS
ncbi:MAG: tetratricopeptide repeat-containing sensor histidine kinase [Bacteroidota bacterium]